ncbi:NAD(P)/FAD-dependent oxidoreductase [Nakamurella deserti]|uniref:NAD(P)/FAD-dependent oxidoreductase n=1 Tax=Nakamurella deserti TaxID=2164074 RepID=UPI000DBE864F|nr:NAD(P)/FAD-dependent oxidoreductase [Nakamurella deserti]
MTETLLPRYDVLVVGGGPAGLNGALMLARSRRSVLVVDSGTPRNAPADGVHGLLGRDGMPPRDLIALGRREILSYGAHVADGDVTAAVRDGDDFVATLADGRAVRARRLLVTTGLTDELADVPGLRELWGRDVVHCPFCHGWEVRDTTIGILGTGPMAAHQALLFRQLSDDVVLFEHTATVTDEDREKLAALGVRIVAGEVAALETDAATGRLTGVRLADGTVVARRTVATASRMVARSALRSGLGLVAVPHPMGAAVGEYIPSEPMGRTSVPGVFVAGNITDLQAQVGAAAAAGALTAAMIHMDLIQQETADAVARYRAAQQVGDPASVGAA